MAQSLTLNLDQSERVSKTTHLLKYHGKQKSPTILIYGVWSYFLLLIFEGALRKWVLPGLSSPLVIIRDPIAIWIILSVWLQGRLVINPYIWVMAIIGLFGTILAVLIGHGNLLVALFGIRIFLIHFPLMFAISTIIDREEVEKIGRIILWLTPPITLLTALQFYSPQSAWVNQGVGADIDGAGFGGAMGYFRPPGTFSFTNGNTLYFSLVACFVFYFWLTGKNVNKVILIVATIALLIAIPLSISRGLFFQVLVSAGFMIIIIVRKPKFMGRLVFSLIGILGILYFVSTISISQNSTEVFLSRFNDANESEGGLNGVLIDRFLGGMYNALISSSDLPFFGYGMGIGSNVGSQLLIGERAFLTSEQEWGRIIGELGSIMGLIVIFLRIRLTIGIAILCNNKLRQGDLLPWMLFSFGSLLLAQGGWAQPTSLGFYTLVGGLILASLRDQNHIPFTARTSKSNSFTQQINAPTSTKYSHISTR